MANTSLNTTNAIRQQVYGEMVQTTLDDDYLADGFMRDITGDFPQGDTYNMPTVGDLVARTYNPDAAESQEVEFDSLDTGRITLTINKYDSVAWYETKKLKEDEYIDIIGMQGLDRAMRGMKVQWETNALTAHNAVQTASAVNLVNGAAHRYVAAGSSAVITINDIAYARFALDKANVPEEGRIAIVDPSLALTLDKLAGAQAFNYNPQFEGLVTTGFRKNMRFLRNIEGFDIYVSNRLPGIVSETINASAYGLANATSPAAAVANLFFSVGSDDTKPVMCAWRRKAELESWLQQDKLDSRDAYKITSRYGFATHRPQGLVTVITGTVG